MPPPARVTIDSSQFPEQVTLSLLESLRSREVNHKFHYDTLKQTQKWLRLHENYSPARTDPDCLRIYRAAFEGALAAIAPGPVQVVGLGCGGGQKDTQLLKLAQQSRRPASYTPCDGSTAMVLVARKAALHEIAPEDCHPLVCDLARAADLKTVLAAATEGSSSTPPGRLFTFFDLICNFEPGSILPRLHRTLEAGDLLLVSGNLAPGPDYTRGVQQVLPLYQNELTSDWLLTFLLDIGVERTDGQIRFHIEETSNPIPLLRIVASFEFARERVVQVETERFEFRVGEAIRLFFSYRHTPELMRSLLTHYGFEVLEDWVTLSSEEGVFLARKSHG